VAKPLEWRECNGCLWKSADLYRIEDNGSNWKEDRYWLFIVAQRTKHPTLEAAKAAAQADYERRVRSALSQPHPADERVVVALRMAHSFIAREYRDEKSLALEGEFVSKEARPVFRALSDALAQEGRNG
jgi:hypothetical protein